MTVYNPPTNEELGTEKPILSSVNIRMRDMSLAIQQNDPTAPDVVYATSSGSVTSQGALATLSTVTTSQLATDIKPWILVGSGSTTGGTGVTIDGAMTSTYDEYRLVAYNVSRAGSSTTLYLRPRDGGADVGNQIGLFSPPVTVSPGGNASFEMYIYQPRATDNKDYLLKGVNSTIILSQVVSLLYTSAIDGFRFYTVGLGPFTGSFKIYGR